MSDRLRDLFLLWPGSAEFLAGRRDRLEPWLRNCGRFTPALSCDVGAWPGIVLAGLCSFLLLGCLISPPATPGEAQAARAVILLALVAGTVGAVGAVQSWRGQRLRAAALVSGRLIEGTITHASGRAVTYPGSREDGTGEPTNFYVVAVEYEFPAPSGERVWASDEAVRNDLEGRCALPAPCQPVLVLYLDDGRFVVL